MLFSSSILWVYRVRIWGCDLICLLNMLVVICLLLVSTLSRITFQVWILIVSVFSADLDPLSMSREFGTAILKVVFPMNFWVSTEHLLFFFLFLHFFFMFLFLGFIESELYSVWLWCYMHAFFLLPKSMVYYGVRILFWLFLLFICCLTFGTTSRINFQVLTLDREISVLVLINV